MEEFKHTSGSGPGSRRGISTADGEILDDCVTGLIALGRVILATVLGAVWGQVGRDRGGRRSHGQACGRNNRRWSVVFLPRLIHAYFCADSAVEVVATAVDPGVVGAQLDSRDIVFLRDSLTGVSLLDCVSGAMVLDAEVTRFREVSPVGLELVVHEELVGGNAM